MDNTVFVILVVVFVTSVVAGALLYSLFVVVPAIAGCFLLARNVNGLLAVNIATLAALVYLYTLLPAVDFETEELSEFKGIIDGLRIFGLSLSYLVFLVIGRNIRGHADAC